MDLYFKQLKKLTLIKLNDGFLNLKTPNMSSFIYISLSNTRFWSTQFVYCPRMPLKLKKKKSFGFGHKITIEWIVAKHRGNQHKFEYL